MWINLILPTLKLLQRDFNGIEIYPLFIMLYKFEVWQTPATGNIMSITLQVLEKLC